MVPIKLFYTVTFLGFGTSHRVNSIILQPGAFSNDIHLLHNNQKKEDADDHSTWNQ